MCQRLHLFIKCSELHSNVILYPQLLLITYILCGRGSKRSIHIIWSCEQVQAITTLRSGKKIDKTIAPKWVNQGEDECRGLGGESERKKSEEERKAREKKRT